LELPIPFIGILEEGYFFVFLPFKCLKKFLITPLTFYRLSMKNYNVHKNVRQ